MLLCAALLCEFSVYAKSVKSTPYKGYEFNSDQASVPAPVGYMVKDVVTDQDMQLRVSPGMVNGLVYDGCDIELPVLLFKTQKGIGKMDVGYHVISFYDLPVTDVLSFALNEKNGYVFLVKASGVVIYNTAAEPVKTVTSEQVGKAFSPVRILHCTEEEEDRFYVVSGSDLVVLDGDGNFLRTEALGAQPIDICYDSFSSALWLLTENQIINYTENETYSFPIRFTPGFFTVDTMAENFYAVSDGKVYRLNPYEEAAEVLETEESPVGMIYHSDGDHLDLLFPSEQFCVGQYGIDGLMKKINGLSFSMSDPADLLYDGGEFVYILDSGNGRVLKTDVTCRRIVNIYESFFDDTQKYSIIGAQGIWIDGDRFFIADTEHERVLVSDFSGKIQKVITKPEKLDSLTAPFRATKILTDRNGRIYVIAESVNLGAFVFSKEYEYQNFFGSNRVLTTAEALYNYFVKKFLNKEQKAAMQSNTPVTLSNFDIDDAGFIYVVTKTDQKLHSTNYTGLIRKINYTGADVLGDEENELLFGDLEWDREKKVVNTSFVDVDVAPNGWITALDGIRGKVFQYSPEGQYITSFGGNGSQYGFMNIPVAIETIGKDIYVIDSFNNSINIFEPTEYVNALHDAFAHMDTADTELAIQKWEKVLSYNSNQSYAHYGLGIAYENAGDYKTAMKHFKIAQARTQYSKAFKEYRKAFVGDHLIAIVAVIVLLVAAVVFAVRKISGKFRVAEGEAYAPIESRKGLPIYVLFHPADGFAQFRTRKLDSVAISLGIVAAFFFLRILEFFATGFIFNQNRPINYNLFSTLLGTVILYFLFVFSTLAISSFLEGKANLRQTMALTSYSMIPFLFALFIDVGLSNILSLDEGVFMNILLVVGCIWSILIMVVGTSQVQEYSIGKTIVSFLLTMVAMFIFAVLGILLFSLSQEVINFFRSVFYELSIR